MLSTIAFAASILTPKHHGNHRRHPRNETGHLEFDPWSSCSLPHAPGRSKITPFSSRFQFSHITRSSCNTGSRTSPRNLLAGANVVRKIRKAHPNENKSTSRTARFRSETRYPFGRQMRRRPKGIGGPSQFPLQAPGDAGNNLASFFKTARCLQISDYGQNQS